MPSMEYTDNGIQQHFDHTHPDGADDLFLSSHVLSPSLNADHEAQSPAGVPCPPGNADRKAKPGADAGDESDYGDPMIQEMSRTRWQKRVWA
jgi:hypothetical protein